MKILAVDSSGIVASVALVSEETLLAEYTINHKTTHSQTLLPMLDEIVKITEINLQELDAIAIAGGPGSFTGLRIGAGTVKGLGFALNKPIINIPTLEGLAYNLFQTDKLICPIMDARRGQVYTGIYAYAKEELITIINQKAILLSDIISSINELKQEVIFIGDAILIYKEEIKELIEVEYTFAPMHLNRQRAGAIGALAVKYLKKGLIESASDYKPEYLRVPQAERELNEKREKEKIFQKGLK